jgi:hypothetical protein
MKARVWDGKNCNTIYVIARVKREKNSFSLETSFYFTSCSTPRKKNFNIIYCWYLFFRLFPSPSRVVWLFFKCQPNKIEKSLNFLLLWMNITFSSLIPQYSTDWWWNHILHDLWKVTEKYERNFKFLSKLWLAEKVVWVGAAAQLEVKDSLSSFSMTETIKSLNWVFIKTIRKKKKFSCYSLRQLQNSVTTWNVYWKFPFEFKFN